jgi:hypothetical protein
MVERHAIADSATPEFLPLARAAALAHARLFPDQPVRESKALDIIALALSALLPLFQRDPETGALRALSESEMTTGRFTRGATTLEFTHRPPLRSLVVSRVQLHEAIETLREDALAVGRMSLASRHAPAKHSRP